MEQFAARDWHPALADPTGSRESKPHRKGQTMVIDKGLGLHAYQDMIDAAGAYIDVIKLGFGTSVLYPRELLLRKVELARQAGIHIMPGGTLLEIAIVKDRTDEFFRSVASYGFTAVEVSDGTIEMNRNLRSSLIIKGIDAGLIVVTEYGKKMSGSRIEIDELVKTVEMILAIIAETVKK